MHPNPAFRGQSRDRNLDFARQRSFGTLVVSGADGPLISHIPFLLSKSGETLDLHLVRSNPIARLSHPTEGAIAVTGPDAYVSPDWYEVPDQVPTWNYVAVHLRGVLERLPDSAMRDMLDRQSAGFERLLAPKPPWHTTKMTSEVLEKMMRMIVPFRMTLTSIDGTWKLNQNKDDAVRLAAANAIEDSGIGQETKMLADLMRNPPIKE